MIKIDFEKIKEFLLNNINKILMILVFFTLINGIWALNQEIDSIKDKIKVNQTLINSLREWNHHLDKKVEKNRKFIEQECAY